MNAIAAINRAAMIMMIQSVIVIPFLSVGTDKEAGVIFGMSARSLTFLPHREQYKSPSPLISAPQSEQNTIWSPDKPVILTHH